MDCARSVLKVHDPSIEKASGFRLSKMSPGFWKKLSALTPGKIKAELDKCVVGQERVFVKF